MPIIEPAIRPPAEAESFLLQVTTGCSANTCTFCGVYKGKPFRIKDQNEIYSDILDATGWEPMPRRVFLMDGDALAISNYHFIPILMKLTGSFPKLNRISSYANGHNITRRSDDELQELYQHKLRLIYLGLESGSQVILDNCHKKSNVTEMVAAVHKAGKVGIKSSVMVLLGLGGKNLSKVHIQETIKTLNLMQPRYLSFLSVMLLPGTELYQAARVGDFKELNSKELLIELREIIAGLELTMTVFRADHASNYLPLEGRLPADKFKLINFLDKAIGGQIQLKSELFRGL